jgi:hypothetical protein
MENNRSLDRIYQGNKSVSSRGVDNALIPLASLFFFAAGDCVNAQKPLPVLGFFRFWWLTEKNAMILLPLMGFVLWVIGKTERTPLSSVRFFPLLMTERQKCPDSVSIAGIFPLLAIDWQTDGQISIRRVSIG